MFCQTERIAAFGTGIYYYFHRNHPIFYCPFDQDRGIPLAAVCGSAFAGAAALRGAHRSFSVVFFVLREYSDGKMPFLPDKIKTSSAVRVDKKTGPESNATFFSTRSPRIESFAGKSALPLFIFGALLLLPGIYHQKKIDPEKFLERAIRNAIRSLAIGFLLIPAFIILYYFAYALTDFIRD